MGRVTRGTTQEGNKVLGRVQRQLLAEQQPPEQNTPSTSPIMTFQTMGGKPSYAKKMIPSTGKTISEPVKTEPPLGFVGKMASAAYDTAKGTFDNAVQRLYDLVAFEPKSPDNVIQKPVLDTPLKRATAMGRAGLSLAGFGFLPVTTQIEAAKELPGPLALPAKIASGIFEDLGKLGSFTLNKVVDELPISDEAKTTMKPFAGELGAFIAQVVGIKAAHGIATKGLEMKSLPLEESTKTKISNVAQMATGLSITPFSTAYGLASSRIAFKVQKAQEAGVEVTPEVGKRIIEEVKQEIQDAPLPEVKTDKPEVVFEKPVEIPKAPEVKTDSVISYINKDNQKVYTTVTPKELSVLRNEIANIPEAKNASQIHLDSVTPTLEKTAIQIPRADFIAGHPQAPDVFAKLNEIQTPRVSGVAKSIEANAIEAKLIKSAEKLTEYDSRNFKEEARKTAELLNTDIESARSVVRGEKGTDIRAGALIAGMEEYAKAHPKEAADIIHELANSPLNATISVGASETSFARMRSSVTSDLAEVKKSYEKKVSNVEGKKSKLKKELKKEAEKLNLSKEELSFNRFLDKITC